jgi:hypothetical protein
MLVRGVGRRERAWKRLAGLLNCTIDYFVAELKGMVQSTRPARPSGARITCR